MTQVRADRDFLNVSRIHNLPPAQVNGQPVVLEQLNAAIEGTNWKDNARVATQANLNLNSPGATIDGVTMSPGDRVLVKANTNAAENGLYLWNGPTAVMTRTVDASTADELENAFVSIDEGTNAGQVWRQTQVNFTLGSGAVAFTIFQPSAPPASETTPGISELATQAEVDAGTDAARVVTAAALANWAGRSRKFAGNIGDGTATQIDVTHNFNTRDVRVEVFRNSTPWDTIDCDVERPDANTVRLRFATGLAPAAAQFRVVILG